MDLCDYSAKFLIIFQWGKGPIHVRDTALTRDEAFAKLRHYGEVHFKKHKKSNNPAICIYERDCFMRVVPKPNKPKKKLDPVKEYYKDKHSIGHGG